MLSTVARVELMFRVLDVGKKFIKERIRDYRRILVNTDLNPQLRAECLRKSFNKVKTQL